MRASSRTTLMVVACSVWALASACDQNNFGGDSSKASAKKDGGKGAGVDDDDDDDKVPTDQVPKKSDGGQKPDAKPDDDPKADDHSEDAIPVVPVDDPAALVDSACLGGAQTHGRPPIAPATPSLPKTAPANCRGGIEFNNFEGGTFKLDAHAALAKAAPLEVDIASYTAEDHMRVIAETAAGEQTIIDTCRLRTAKYADPTDGHSRPPEDSIRSFRLKAPKGTTALRFDWTGANSPTYIRLVGLCDFDQTASGGNPQLRPISN